LEVVLSVPGCFFGMPAILAVAPSIVAAATSNTNTVSRQSVITLGAGGLLLCLWGVVLSVPRHSERIALKLFSMRACVVGPAVGMYLVESNPGFGAAARSQAHLTLLSWFVSLAPTLVIKHQTRRRRPLVCEAAQLGEITSKSVALKRLSIIPHLLRRDSNAAFPSGDAVGALVFAYSLHRCGYRGWALTCALGSCAGRIYWHAHHVLDVTTGAAIGFGTSAVLDWLTSVVSWQHAAAAQAVLTVIALVCGTTKTIKVASPSSTTGQEKLD